MSARVTQPPVVVLDTNVLVAAGFEPRSACARVVDAIRAGTLRMAWDDATRRESERIVLRIPPLRRSRVLDVFAHGTRHEGETRAEEFGFVPDPDDRKFAALAAAAGATLLTLDAHLLDAEAADASATARVEILRPSAFLARLEAANGRG